jgi:hypothetical protein
MMLLQRGKGQMSTDVTSKGRPNTAKVFLTNEKPAAL